MNPRGGSKVVYPRYNEADQPRRAIADYPRSLLRTPAAPFVERPLTRSERTGPVNLDRRLRLGPVDLSRPAPDGPQAVGQYISIEGRVLDEGDTPVEGALLELWQANSAGKYTHELDRNNAPVDPVFTGACRLLTDADGRFAFRTIKPGAYPVPHSTWEWRAPHIHVSILGSSWMSRLITQLFFPDEWLNRQDLLINSIPNPDARARLIIRPQATVVRPSDNLLAFDHQFVLRGRRRTPTLIDADDDVAPGPISAHLTTGPFFPLELLDPGTDDLTRYDGREARGERMILTGRVVDEKLEPAVNAVVEIWQADSGGVFRHPADPDRERADPGFCGWGRTATDATGTYRFVTVTPGRYVDDSGVMRLPHINVQVFASGIMRPLATTTFLPDAAGATGDPVLAAVEDPERQARLRATRDASAADGAPVYRFDIHLRGRTETPFFAD